MTESVKKSDAALIQQSLTDLLRAAQSSGDDRAFLSAIVGELKHVEDMTETTSDESEEFGDLSEFLEAMESVSHDPDDVVEAMDNFSFESIDWFARDSKEPPKEATNRLEPRGVDRRAAFRAVMKQAKQFSQQALNDPFADPEDVDWANKILVSRRNIMSKVSAKTSRKTIKCRPRQHATLLGQSSSLLSKSSGSRSHARSSRRSRRSLHGSRRSLDLSALEELPRHSHSDKSGDEELESETSTRRPVADYSRSRSRALRGGARIRQRRNLHDNRRAFDTSALEEMLRNREKLRGTLDDGGQAADGGVSAERPTLVRGSRQQRSRKTVMVKARPHLVSPVKSSSRKVISLGEDIGKIRSAPVRQGSKDDLAAMRVNNNSSLRRMLERKDSKDDLFILSKARDLTVKNDLTHSSCVGPSTKRASEISSRRSLKGNTSRNALSEAL